jgi:hypothetical protein
MSIPGFTAEASIGPTTQVNRVQDRYGAGAASSLYPQLNGGEMHLGSEEDLGNEAVMDMAEQVAGAESDEGLGDEDAMAMTEHVTVVDHDEVHVEV